MRFSPTRLALMAAAAATLATTAAVAVAQEAGPPPGPPPMADDGPNGFGGPGGPGGPPPGAHHRFDPEAHAQRLRDVLQLRPEQDGALKAYLAATAPPKRPEGEGPGGKPEDGPPKRLTTPERLDRETQFLAHAKARIDATRSFYGALSPSQQKAFDALGPMGGPGGPGMHRTGFRHGKHDFKRGPGGPPPAAVQRKAS